MNSYSNLDYEKKTDSGSGSSNCRNRRLHSRKIALYLNDIMSKNKLLWLTACLSLAMSMVGCKNANPKEIDIAKALSSGLDTLSWTLLPADEIIPIPRGLAVSDTTIAVLGRYQDCWVHTYSKSTGKAISSFLRIGQGPGEIVRGSVMNLVSDSLVSIYDYDKMDLFTVGLCSGTVIKCSSLVGIANIIDDAWALSETEALIRTPVRTQTDELSRAFAIVNLQSKKTLSEYNNLTGDLENNSQMLMSQPALAISPDKKHFASTTMVGGTIETFSIENNDIKPLFSKVIHPTEYVTNGNMVQPENPVYVFLYSCSSDDFLYTSYANSEDVNEATKIAVWDWEGNLLKCYETGMLIYKLAYDATSNSIYGIVEGDEGPALARLNLDI